MDEANKAATPLTDLQKAVLSKKLDAIRADFNVVALHLLCADGSEWKIGEFPQPEKEKKPKTRRGFPEGYVMGTIGKMIKPWLELAYENPNQTIKLRPHDFDGIEFKRIKSALSGACINQRGKGSCTVRTMRDEEGEAVLFTYTPDAVSKAVHIPNGNHSMNGAGHVEEH